MRKVGFGWLASITLSVALLLSAVAKAQVTQAWQLRVNELANAKYPASAQFFTVGFHPVDCDVLGNVYCGWQSPVGPPTAPVRGIHLAKFNQSGTLLFDAALPNVPNTGETLEGCYVSPVVGGQQYVYLVANLNNYPNQSALGGSLWIMKFSASGRPLWPVAFQYKAPVGEFTSMNPGFYADPLGNVFLAFTFRENIPDDPYPHYPLKMVEINSDGQVVSDHENPNVQPGFLFWPFWDDFQRPNEPRYTLFDPIRHRWLVEGRDINDTAPNSSVGPNVVLTSNIRWGIYDPDTGAEDYHEISPDSPDEYYFVFSLFPNGNLAVSTNSVFMVSRYPQLCTLSRSTRLFTPDNQPLWSYPASGTLSGNVIDLAANDASSSIYVSVGNFVHTQNGQGFSPSNPQFLERLDWNGNRTLLLNNKQVGAIFPTPTGFFSSGFYVNPADPNNGSQLDYDYSFVSHFDALASGFDYVQSYWMAPTFQTSYNVSPGWVKGFAQSANVNYALSNVESVDYTANPTFYESIFLLQRFVTGLNLESVSAPSSVPHDSTVPVVITLNGPAGHYGYIVGLFSNSSSLLMPNSTKSQNFRIPAGQKSITVNLNAGSVTSNTMVTLLATQNYVRRGAAITITP